MLFVFVTLLVTLCYIIVLFHIFFVVQATTVYCRLLLATLVYHMLETGWYRSLQVTTVSTGNHRLLQVATVYYLLLQIATGY